MVRMIRRLSAALVVVLACSETRAGLVIVDPTFVSGQNLNTDTAIGASVANLTNNSGLSSPVQTGSSLAFAESVTHSFGPYKEVDSWATDSLPGNYFAFRPDPVFVWDLGRDYTVSDIVLWQYANDGGANVFGPNRDGNATRTFSLRFSTEAQGAAFSGPNAFDGTMTRCWATGGINPAQTFDLGRVSARYIELTITSNYFRQAGVLAGGDRVGLGEIRFGVQAVPEPSSMTLALSGAICLGACLWRRRAKRDAV